jgi:hypothetical protein
MSTNTAQPAQIPGTESALPTERNPAVQRCCEARERSLEFSQAKKIDSWIRKESAAAAYCEAMPNLSGYENIRDYIACTAHGMVIKVIDRSEGPKLLYAAQVALSALRSQPKSENQGPHTPPPEIFSTQKEKVR